MESAEANSTTVRLRWRNIFTLFTRDYILEVICDCGEKSKYPVHLRVSGIDTIVTDSGVFYCPGCNLRIPYSLSY